LIIIKYIRARVLIIHIYILTFDIVKSENILVFENGTLYAMYYLCAYLSHKCDNM